MMFRAVFNTIKSRLLQPPTFENNERNRIAGMLHTVILSLFAATTLSTIVLSVGGQPELGRVLFLFLLVPVIGLFMVQRGLLGQATILIIGAALVVQLYLLLESSGIYDIAIIIYPLILLVSSLVVTRRWYFFVFGLVVLSATIAAYGASSTSSTYITDLIILITLLAVTAAAIDGLTSNLITSLQRTQENEQKLLEANQQLTRQTVSMLASEARWRSLVENAPDTIIGLQRDGIIQSTNLTTENNLVGQSIFKIISPEYRTAFSYALEQVFVTGETMQMELKALNQYKQSRWFSVRLGVVSTTTGTVSGSTLVARDITDQKEAAAALLQSEERYRSVVENSLSGIFIVNEKAQYIYVNQEMCRLVGYSEQELLGRDFRTLLTPESRGVVSKRYRQRQQGNDEPVRYELGVIRQDGQRRDMEISAAVVKAPDGTPRTIGQMLDITDRKQAENALQDYATELEHSNRELREFTNVASHDLQEPLRKIQTFSDRIQQRYAPLLPESGQDYINRIRSAAFRMQALIQALLNLSQVTQKAIPFTWVSLTDLIQEVLSDLEIQITNRSARIEIDDMPHIQADKTQMYQLFQNLISNGLKFQQEGRPPHILIESATTTTPDTDRQVVTIKVTDNGIGFEEKYADRIFSVFQRLHNRDAYDGTGIGLAICRRVVERHHGTITASSRPNYGSTFTITLPLEQDNTTEQE
jgi:two-component system sensor kinase FixL